MSKENEEDKKSNLIQNNNLEEEINQEKNKGSSKRRRKELIDFDNEEDKNINNENINEINTIQKEELKEKNIIEIKKNIDMNDSCNNKFKTLDKCQNSHSPFRNNLVLQEKLKKIFLNREKIQFQYTKQEIPDYLKYHSDDSDDSENIELRKKENNNNKKESNLISNISDKKYIENNNEKIIADENNINNEINNENKSEKKLEEINEELKKDLTNNYNEELLQDEKNNDNLSENNNKNEKLIENNKIIEKNEISSNLIPEKVNNNLNKEEKEIFNDALENNKKEENNSKTNQESNKDDKINIQNNKETENNQNKKNKLTINVNKNVYKEQINKKERVNDLFDIIGKLKKNQSESVTNKNTKKKLDIIKFPKKEELNNNKNNNNHKIKNNENNINIESQEKNKNNNNNNNKNLDIYLTNKDSKKINQIQTIDLPYRKNSSKEINISYSSKGITHIKYTQNKNNNIPVRKASELNRYKNIPNENSIDIELNTTPSSHLDRSYDAINNNNININKENRSINVYRPKKINKNKLGKNIQNKQNKENKMNNIIPNQNIIYNNFNNFFNSPGIYNNNTNNNNINNNNFKNYFHRKNQKSFDEYEINSAINNPINNSFDGYINHNFNNDNNIRENEFIYYGQNDDNTKINNISRYKSINMIPINQLNNNKNLVFNNFYRNANINKSYGNIFNGINNNNNIFDNNNYMNSDEYIGNLSTKNNSIQNPKFITYNIVNSNPIHRKYPIKTVLNPIRQYNINNINIESRRGTTSILNHCLYNNKFNNSIYPKNNKINIANNVQQIQQQNKTTKKASINIEDLLVLEEKMSEIIYSLNKNGVMYNECFEFWNYYYNCSLFGQLENLFKTQNDKANVQISINHILLSIMICYDYSYEIETLYFKQNKLRK